MATETHKINMYDSAPDMPPSDEYVNTGPSNAGLQICQLPVEGYADDSEPPLTDDVLFGKPVDARPTSPQLDITAKQRVTKAFQDFLHPRTNSIVGTDARSVEEFVERFSAFLCGEGDIVDTYGTLQRIISEYHRHEYCIFDSRTLGLIAIGLGKAIAPAGRDSSEPADIAEELRLTELGVYNPPMLSYQLDGHSNNKPRDIAKPSWTSSENDFQFFAAQMVPFTGSERRSAYQTYYLMRELQQDGSSH